VNASYERQARCHLIVEIATTGHTLREALTELAERLGDGKQGAAQAPILTNVSG